MTTINSALQIEPASNIAEDNSREEKFNAALMKIVEGLNKQNRGKDENGNFRASALPCGCRRSPG
jgi:hypothetical protein